MSRILGNLEERYDRTYSDSELVRRYSTFIGEHWRHLLFTILAIIAGTILTLFIPFTLQEGVDSFSDGNREAVIIAAVEFLALNLLAWLANAVQTYENTKFTALTTRDIRSDLFERVQNHDLSFFDSNKTGKLMSRIMDDTNSLAEFVSLTSGIATNIFVAVGTVVILFFINVKLTLLALSVVPFLVVFVLLFRRLARKLARDWRVAISKLNDSFQENISGIAVSKSFGRQDKAKEEFEELNIDNFKVNFKRGAYFSSIFPVVFAMSNIGLALVLYYGGLDAAVTGVPTAGTIVLYVAYLQRFYFPVIQITSYYNNLQAGLAAAERIFSLMDVHSKVENTGTDKINTVTGEITFEHVTFSYEKDIKVFDDFTLSIKPGETVALVGHTGAGKSSLISLLLRFYELTDGRILLDGKDIKEYDLDSYRTIIGMVLQDPLLFSGTIRSNIAYGVNDATDEQIMKAAQAANLEEFINQQPDGLDTQIQERGRRLSQGQRQLMSIARAFMVDPELLLLDEATASIDAYSEALIQEAIDRLLHDRTSIIIAHRLTTVKRADRIVVLDHGKIIEVGPHEELLAKGGQYANLYKKYFAFQAVEAGD